MTMETFVGATAAALFGWIGASIAWAFRTTDRLSALEADNETLKVWLQRFEAKLDRVIEDR